MPSTTLGGLTMPALDHLEKKVDALEARLDRLVEHVPAAYKLEIVSALEPLKRIDAYVAGAVALAVILLSVGGFLLKATFSEMSETVDEAKASLLKVSEETKELSSNIERLKNELNAVDANLSSRFQKVEQSVEDIISQPLPPQNGSIGDGEQVGTIVYPVPDTEVGSEFEARGTVSLETNQVAWLAVRIGRLYWPKEPAITTSGPWTRLVYEGGAAGKKVLALLIVDDKTNKEIRAWFDAALQTGSYRGIRLDKKAIAVAEIPFLLR